MITRHTTLVTAAIALASFAGGAHAADLEAEVLQQAGVTPVEFGSGWYLRGDVGTYGGHADLGYDGGGTVNLQDFHIGERLSAGIGVGYIFNEAFRADVTLTHRRGFGFDGTSAVADCGVLYTGECYYVQSGNSDMTSLEANGYFSLGGMGALKPYVGGGVGATWISWRNYNSREFCILDPGETCNGATNGGATRAVYAASATDTERDGQVMFTYSLAAGIDWRLDERWTVDLGYKYSGMTDFDSNSSPWVANFESMSLHEVRVGLRYEIW